MTSTREAITMLRQADPVPSPEGSRERSTAPEHHVRIDRSPAGGRPRRSRHTLVLAGAAATLTVAVGLGVVPLPWTHGSASPAAAAALDQAASAADIAAVDETARADQYWLIRTVGIYVGYGDLVTEDGTATEQGRWLERAVRVEYASVDGSRPGWFVDAPRTVVEVLSGEPPATARRAAEVWTTGLAPNEVPGSWQAPNAAWLATLPRDTENLRDRLYDDTSGRGSSHDGEVLVYVADVLRSGMVPADLRAALFRVLETVPGVDIVQRHEDGLISIGRLETTNGQRQEIVIDPSTGAYFGERRVQVKSADGIPAGTVTEDVTVRRSLVDEVPPRVTEAAVRYACTASPDGAVSCEGG